MDVPIDEGFYSATSNSTAFTTNNQPTTIKQVYEELESQLKDKIYADTPGFFDTLFDQTVHTAAILEEAMSKKLYNRRNRCWRGLASPPRDEKALYGPFVEAANFIAGSAALKGQDNGLHVHWLSDPDRPPSKSDPLAAQGKPDIVGVRDGQALEEAAKKASAAGTVGLRGKQKKKGKVTAGAVKPHPSWYDSIIPVEVKKYEDDTSAIRQLCNYIRQIFHDAMDRRFILGLVLAGHYLTVWLADRSGLIGSEAFNINQEPERFIRVIAAISAYPQERLGLDTTLTRYTPKETDFAGETPRPKWEPEPEKERYEDEECRLKQGPLSHEPMEEGLSDSGSVVGRLQTKPRAEEGFEQDEVRWRVEIEGIAFILWKPLSILRGEVIQGRATRIWRAWKEDEMHKPMAERTKYVVKDTWRDKRRGLEGDFYRQIGECDGVAECVASATCTINGVEDDTLMSVRKGLVTSGVPVNFTAPQITDGAKGKAATHAQVRRDARDADDPHLKSAYLDYLPPCQRPPDSENSDQASSFTYRPRVHSRTVMKTYGWLIKSSLCRLELVGALRDAVAGHQNALRKEVLHRDISIGNILITGDRRSGKRGVLIDFENAKRTTDSKVLADDPLSFTYPFCSGEIIKARHYNRPVGDRKKTPARAPVHDLESFFWVLCYICLTRLGPNKRRPILDADTPQDNGDDIRDLVYRLFDADLTLLATTKEMMFASPEKFQETVEPCISPYWMPLWPLIKRLFSCLFEAYKHRPCDDLHGEFLAAFDECEATLRRDAENGTIVAMRGIETYQERERRRRDRDDKQWTWQPSPRGPNPQQQLLQQDTGASKGKAAVADPHARSESPSERPAKRRRKAASGAYAVDPSSAGPSARVTTRRRR